MNNSHNNLEIMLRKADKDDYLDLWNWRNDPKTRSSAFNQEYVPLEVHTQWYEQSLLNKDRTIFIATTFDTLKVGQIRFDQEDKHAEVDITIAPEYRGKGYGCKIIIEGSKLYFNQHPKILSILAKIKPENQASLHAFRLAGFKETYFSPQYIQLELLQQKT